MPSLTQSTRITLPVLPMLYYKANSAPCFVSRERDMNKMFIRSLNTVGKKQYLDQIKTEIIWCLHFNLAQLRFESAIVPKFADNTIWLINQFNGMSRAANLPRDLVFQGLLYDAVDLLDAAYHTPHHPVFMNTHFGRVKETAGVMFNMYRFQLMTRAKRVLNATDYRGFLEVCHSNNHTEVISMRTLEALCTRFGIYDENLGVARRNQNVIKACDFLKRILGLGNSNGAFDIINHDRTDAFECIARLLNPRGLTNGIDLCSANTSLYMKNLHTTP